MRFIHTADWHLGRVLHDVSLEPFQERFLDHMVELTKDVKPDGLLLAGDVFDRAIASTTSIELLEDALSRLIEHTRVVLIPGNHDSATRLGFGAQLFRERIEIVSRLARIGKPTVFGAGPDAVNVYSIPYLEPDVARRALAEKEPGDDSAHLLERSHDAVMAAALRRVATDMEQRPGRAIAMVHAFIAGGSASDSERDISVGGAQNVFVSTFENLGGETSAARPLDYVACGHLHRPQDISASIPIRYSGSPMPFSFSEANDHKTTSIISLEDTRPRVEYVDVPQTYELRQVAGTLQELTEQAPSWAQHAYVSVEVTDLVRPDHLFAKVRAVYPKALVIRHTGFSRELGAHMPRAHVDPMDMTVAFFRHALGRAPNETELAIIEHTWTQMRMEADAS
ncbi:MAG: exonuclease subunit SbcD [Actinomycetaceae bacterium]|nr:exonuclease subunit SbcD [Actinomycetaceae bacterium]